jgi:hypothetical protein
MVVLEDGEYDSVSDFDDDTLALIAARDGANSDSDKEMEVMGAETADQYKSLVAQRVLSVQLSKAEHDQCHNLFQTRGVVKERAMQFVMLLIVMLLIVMLYLCKLVLCYLVDHCNLIENLYIIVKLISILLHMLVRKLDLNP